MLTISASAQTNNFIIIVSSASSIPFNEDEFWWAFGAFLIIHQLKNTFGSDSNNRSSGQLGYCSSLVVVWTIAIVLQLERFLKLHLYHSYCSWCEQVARLVVKCQKVCTCDSSNFSLNIAFQRLWIAYTTIKIKQLLCRIMFLSLKAHN